MFNAVYTYFGKDEIVRDIIRFCVDNSENIDFGEKLDITYKRLEYGFACVTVVVNYKDYATIKDFELVAELVKEV